MTSNHEDQQQQQQYSPCLNTRIAIRTFSAMQHPTDKCGSNGLPLTPNAILIYGRFQRVKALCHPFLCEQISLQCGKNQRLLLAAEFPAASLESFALSTDLPPLDGDMAIRIARQSLEALAFLNNHEIVHGCLAPRCIRLTEQNDVKIAEYLLYYITGDGMDVSFPIGEPRYMSPEVIAAGPTGTGGSGIRSSDRVSTNFRKFSLTPKVDVWALGIILLEASLGGPWFPLRKNLKDLFTAILTIARKHINDYDGASLLEDIIATYYCDEVVTSLAPDVHYLLTNMLVVLPERRLTPAMLLENPVFAKQLLHQRKESPSQTCEVQTVKPPLSLSGRSSADLQLPSSAGSNISLTGTPPNPTLWLRAGNAIAPPTELFFFWRLMGGDVESQLIRSGRIRSKPPLCLLPRVALTDSCILLGAERDASALHDFGVNLLDLVPLQTRLEKLDTTTSLLSSLRRCNGSAVNDDHDNREESITSSGSNLDKNRGANITQLPITIRETDVEYQFLRLHLFEHLLDAYPHTREEILRQAKIDIPPLLRGKVWAAVLGISGDYIANFEAIDKTSITPTDRQIEVDIPRCHQYDQFLSSSAGHQSLRRLLKAWVAANPNLEYWQGIDSLCAPFLVTNLSDEALAFACLNTFIDKFLHHFFLHDNSSIIQEYLSIFRRLLAFHNPKLASHLEDINFVPELFAIPWFLTMYTHVFPLQKIVLIWDRLLLGPSGYPLCFAVAILNQLQEVLLSFSFNECILLFSYMPDVDIEECNQECTRLLSETPPSLLRRWLHDHSLATTASTTGGVDSGNIRALGRPRAWWDTPASLDVLRAELAPRISVSDFLTLREVFVIIDVRSVEEFGIGHYRSAINIQPRYLGRFLDSLLSFHGRFIAISGARGRTSAKFATKLVKAGFPHVCTLIGGIDALRLAAPNEWVGVEIDETVAN